MTRRPVKLHPAAVEDAQAAVEWYERRNPRVAQMFLDQLTRTIERASEHPEQHPEFGFGTRRALIRKFPFLVIFRETPSSIEVVAVAHGRRRPGYWRGRLEG